MRWSRWSWRPGRPGRVSALLALLALSFATASLAGCKRKGSHPGAAGEDAGAGKAEPVAHAEPGRQRIVITNIALRTVDPPVAREVAELWPRELAQALGRSLLGSGLFAASAEHVPEGFEARPAVLDVSIHYDVVEADSAGELAVMVGVESGFVWEDEGARDPAPWDQLLVERPVPAMVPPSEHDALVAVLASDAIERLAERLAERERVRAGGEAALAEVLADADAEPSAVRWALDLIAHRRVQSLFDQVTGTLDAESAEVRQRAVTALAVLGGTRAVSVITERVRFDDTESLGVVIDTVAVLGGEDARTYLEFVASGHPEDEIRARASAALARMAPAPPETP
ncbi:MAG TPA: hypothetical protein VNM90_27535 [Haliangium sp.]|nr:hypothetical protein [Haliangium sp.]